MACRRACPPPRLAGVIRRSSSGLTALAFASVVWIRSWSITSRQRFEKSALRCEALLESFPFCRRCRMAKLARSQREPPSVQRLLDLLDRLPTEVGDRVQLGLALLDEVAHRLHPRPLEAVVRADAQLELLDQDVVHPAGTGHSAAVARDRGLAAHQGGALVAKGLDAVDVGEDRQVLDQDLRG